MGLVRHCHQKQDCIAAVNAKGNIITNWIARGVNARESQACQFALGAGQSSTWRSMPVNCFAQLNAQAEKRSVSVGTESVLQATL
jgi:hypothetical protein